jgi:hypothetical protein
MISTIIVLFFISIIFTDIKNENKPDEVKEKKRNEYRTRLYEKMYDKNAHANKKWVGKLALSEAGVYKRRYSIFGKK